MKKLAKSDQKKVHLKKLNENLIDIFKWFLIQY